jgi:hypothetical protein
MVHVDGDRRHPVFVKDGEVATWWKHKDDVREWVITILQVGKDRGRVGVFPS